MLKIASVDLSGSNFSIALFQLKSADLAGNLYSSLVYLADVICIVFIAYHAYIAI